MNQIKTKIDGVPVVLELIQVGPADIKDIDELNKNLKKEEQPVKIPANHMVRVLEVGDENTTEEEKQNVKDKVDGKDTAELIGDLVESLENTDKDWYLSKTVWVNVIAIAAAIGAYFGLDINIEPEAALTLASVIMSVVNLALRKTTKSGIRFKKQK